jgi:sterol desaturase/sphingolipid hydroxylase (fatty acid hydroxylase superfamily)
MKTIGTMNVLITGCVSAVLHGATAIIFIPVLAAIFLGQGLGPLQSSGATEGVMVMVLLAPICWIILGFIFGAVMAFLYNVFTAAFMRHKVHHEPTALSVAAGRRAA